MNTTASAGVTLWLLTMYSLAFFYEAAPGLILASAAACFLGKYFADRLALAHNDSKLLRIAPLFHFKLCLTILVANRLWVPLMYAARGYDPERYYYQALDLADANFNLYAAPVEQLNYMGVVYFYAGVFKVFGRLPEVAAIVNCICTMAAVALLIHAYYCLRPVRGRHDWVLSLSILLPEIVWFDALTSRETLVLALLHLSTLPLALYFLAPSRSRRFWQIFLVSGASLVLLALVRAWVVFPACGSALAYYLVSRAPTRPSRVLRWFLVVVLLCIPPALLTLGTVIGSATTSLPAVFVTASPEIVQDFTTESLVAKQLIPHAPWQFVAYAPIRIVANIVAPMPYYFFGFQNILLSQETGQALTAVFFIATLPLVLSGAFAGIRSRLFRAWWCFAAPYFLIMVSIAMGFLGVHSRYRVMGGALFCGCAWVGRLAPKRTTMALYALWAGVGLCGAVWYFTLRRVF